jgi:uncharacterized protein YndB with AHSA1/START domain
MTTQATHNVDVIRDFEAPVERVWEAWTESDQVKRWWGPQGFTAPVANMDVREGGTSLVCMRSPDGHDLFNTWTYERVDRPRRLEFVNRFADRDGATLDPASIGLPADIPRDVRHVLVFEATGAGMSRLRVTEYGYGTQETAALSKMGLEQCLDKMAESFSQT